MICNKFNMKQEDKELLLKDLCGRLPYRVVCQCDRIKAQGVLKEMGMNYNMCRLYDSSTDEYEDCFIFDCRPYLFPLSSITEEQSRELFKLYGISLVDSIGADYIKINECNGITFFLNKGFDIETHLNKLIDWLNKKHFDYRGLVEKGLAINCTNLNIY